jgi:hypothetical protein
VEYKNVQVSNWREGKRSGPGASPSSSRIIGGQGGGTVPLIELSIVFAIRGGSF